MGIKARKSDSKGRGGRPKADRTGSRGKRAGKGAKKTVDAYIDSLDGWQAVAVTRLRDLIRDAVPEAEEAIKWGQPVFSHGGPFCYIRAFKKHVNLGFWRGLSLRDLSGLLQSGGEKMAHVKLTGPDDVRPDAFRAFAREAALLNQRLGDPSRTK